MPDVDPRRSAGTLQSRRKPLAWPSDREFRILSIDGGGIRGILPAAFLASLEERYLKGANIGDCFDLIVGTSTGGILALGIGKGLTARELLALYMDRGGDIFPDYMRWKRLLVGCKHLVFTRCSREHLDELIDKILGETRLWESQKRLCIPSIDAKYGEVFVFKTPHHPDFRKDWIEPMAKAARATSAAQSFFKPISDEKYIYLDGGIWANNPVMIGLVDALSAFDITRNQIRVLSLGCVEDTYQINWWHRHLGGKLTWPSNVIDGSMHLQSMNAVGQAGLLVGRDRLLRVNYPPIKPKLEMYDWARCREILPEKAAELISQYGDRVNTEFLYDKAAAYTPIYTPASPPSDT